MDAISIKNLKKVYKNKFSALKGIDLNIKQGDFFALLGPNGAGKSTTIGILFSLVNKTEGEVKILGVDIDKDFGKAKTYMGLVPQEFNLNIFEKVKDIVMTQAGYYGIPRDVAEERAEKYLKQLGLWEKRDNKAMMLSGGMKRRLMIARALIHEPKILVLDEPTAGVDIELRTSMWEFIKELNAQGTTIILTTHYLEEAEELCKNVAIIDHGDIIINTSVRSLLKKADSQTIIIDIDKELDKTPELRNCEIKKIDSTTFEIKFPKEVTLSNVFSQLSKKDINVISMRNKRNRLEELFLELTSKEKEKEKEIKNEKKSGGKK